MKLGTETGSLVNHMMARENIEPRVGMGATILCWTDRRAATIVKVTRTQVHVQQDIAKRVRKPGEPDMTENQEYEYTPDPTASIEVFRKTKRGWWSTSGHSLSIGEREEYYDHSF